MGTIVYRRDRQWAGGARAFEIEVERKPVGELKSKDTLRTEVSPGNHSVQARMGGACSWPVEVRVDDGAEVSITFRFVKNPTFNMIFKPEGSIEARVER